MTAPPILILPGIGGSGPAHWQSLWQDADPTMTRLAPTSWDEPRLDDWLAALDRAVAAQPTPPILVAHSLACLLVVHWAARGGKAAGALLVATPDPRGPSFPPEAASFGDPPQTSLPFPALMAASSDDPYGSLDYARGCAAAWNASLVVVGALGHINGASGLGDWPQGRGLLDRLVAAVS